MDGPREKNGTVFRKKMVLIIYVFHIQYILRDDNFNANKN